MKQLNKNKEEDELNEKYDVTFIGSGHAAWHALTLKHAGKVAIIEKSVLREHAQTGVMLKSYLKIHLKC